MDPVRKGQQTDGEVMHMRNPGVAAVTNKIVLGEEAPENLISGRNGAVAATETCR